MLPFSVMGSTEERGCPQHPHLTTGLEGKDWLGAAAWDSSPTWLQLWVGRGRLGQGPRPPSSEQEAALSSDCRGVPDLSPQFIPHHPPAPSWLSALVGHDQSSGGHSDPVLL